MVNSDASAAIDSVPLPYQPKSSFRRHWFDRIWIVAPATAIFAATVCFVWLPLGFLKLFFLACMGQGILVGIGLHVSFAAGRIHRRAIAFCWTLVAVFISASLIYVGLYLREVANLAAALNRTSSPLSTVGLLFQPRSYRLADFWLLSTVHHGGFAGYLLLRFRNQTFVTVAMVHWLLTGAMAWAIAKKQLSNPFCRVCGNWMRIKNIAVLPERFADPLVEAVRLQDIQQGLAVTNVSANLPLGQSCSIARLHSCFSCGEKQMEVVVKNYARRSNQYLLLLAPVKTSDPFIDALKSEPVESADLS